MPLDFDTIRQILEHRLQQEDIERLLEKLDDVGKARLFYRITELVRRTSALVDIANRVSDSLSLDVLFPRLMEVVTETLNADRSSLFLHDPDTNELFSRVMQGNAMGEIRFPADMGFAGAVFTSAQAQIIADAYADPRFNAEVDRRTGYRTRNILCVPIRTKQGKVIGVTQALNKQTGDFDVEDQRLLEGLSTQAAAALENARLFERVERQQREEAMLLEVASSIATELNLDPLLERIMTAATQLLEADRGTLFLYDKRKNELFSRIAGGVEGGEIRFPAGAGIAGECFTTGQTINIADAHADPRFNPSFDLQTGYRTRSMLCMPITAKGERKVGVIQILNRRSGRTFGPGDESRLRAFCAQVAVSIENAQLFGEVHAERDYNEAILRSMNNAVFTLDADAQLRKVNDAAVRILRRPAAELVDRPLETLFHGRNQWVAASLAKVRSSGKTDNCVDTEVFVEGLDAVSVNLTTVPLKNLDDQPIGYLMVMEDITAEKRLRNNMSRYMSKAVVDQLLEGGEAVLGGAGREVSVLFADIRGFTSITERLGPRETVALLNEYFTDMVDVVFAHGGVLDKYIGDMIMAVFGSVTQTEQDAGNAVEVGNRMMAALRELNLRREAQGREAIRIGVGISTGEVIAGNIGSPRRLEYTVIGDRVNLAERLESANKYYGTAVLMCQATQRKLRPGTATREIDLIRVRGMSQPVSIHEALGHHTEATFPNRERLLEAFADGLARYRRREWANATRSFRDALAAHPGDAPSRIYLQRCEAYERRPPAVDWDGVWTMQES